MMKLDILYLKSMLFNDIQFAILEALDCEAINMKIILAR